MPERTSEATWKGNLKEGDGTMKLQGGAYDGPYSFASRFESGDGTNPEELIAAAHAGCYSMALSGALEKAGYPPQEVNTRAEVNLDMSGDAPTISRIRLVTRAAVDGISDSDFQEQARDAKENCPVSRALASVDIELDASLQ